MSFSITIGVGFGHDDGMWALGPEFAQSEPSTPQPQLPTLTSLFGPKPVDSYARYPVVAQPSPFAMSPANQPYTGQTAQVPGPQPAAQGIEPGLFTSLWNWLAG